MPKYWILAGHSVAKSLAGKGVRGRYEPRLSHPLSIRVFFWVRMRLPGLGPAGLKD